MGKVLYDTATPTIFDRLEIQDINALQTVNVNATQFGEDLVAARTPIIELNSSYGISALRDGVTVTGSGAVTASAGSILVTTSATASSTAKIESAEIGRYIPGYGAQLGIGIRIPTLPTGNQIATWGGIGQDGDNSFRMGVDATGTFVSIVRGGVEVEKVYQVNWNIDKLDGTGSSDYVLDLTRGVIFQIEFTWYGFGEVLFGVIGQTVDSNGFRKQRFIPCHQFRPSGTVSIESPNLKVYADADNGGDAANLDVYVGGRQYSIVGQFVPKYRLSSDFRGQVSTSTTVTPLVSARRKSGFGDRSIKLASIEAIAGNSSHLLEVRIGGTLTGASFGTPTNHTAAETALEYDRVATAITGGIVIDQSLVPASNGATRALTANIFDLDLPNGEIISLCARTITGTSNVAASLMQLKEEW